MQDIEDFISFRDYVASLSAKDIERRDELGAGLAFSAAPKLIDNLNKLLATFTDEVARLASRDTWNNVKGLCENFRSIMSGIRSFNIRNPAHNSSQKDALEAQLQESYNQIFRSLAPIISASNIIIDSSSLGGRIDEIFVKANESVRKIEKNIAKLNDEAEKKNNVLDELVASAQDKAAELVSTVEAEHFSSASQGYRAASKAWLIATIGLGISILGLAAVSFYWADAGRYAGRDSVSIAQIALSKVLIFAILIYSVNICSRNYFANKHNETVNNHRKNAILSYRALIAPTSAPENRDIILVHAASAVFAPQDSAYVKQPGGNIDVPPTFLASLTKTGG